MIGEFFPAGIVCAEGPILSERWDATPEEAARAASFADKRRHEFLTGRTYARRAILRLQPEAPTLAADDDRAPRWPAGIVGSITHSRTWCVAAIGPADVYRSVGIDIEDLGRVKESIRRLVCRDSETARLGRVAENLRGRYLSLIFSAKEAFFKMQFPLTRAWVGFQDAEVTWDESGFTLGLLKDIGAGFGKGDAFKGRFVFTESHILTAVLLPAGSRFIRIAGR